MQGTVCCHTFVLNEENWSLFAGVLATLKAVPQKEGILGLYKGNGAMMVRIFPYGAIQFMAFDNYKKVQYKLLFITQLVLLLVKELTFVSSLPVLYSC